MTGAESVSAGTVRTRLTKARRYLTDAENTQALIRQRAADPSQDAEDRLLWATELDLAARRVRAWRDRVRSLAATAELLGGWE